MVDQVVQRDGNAIVLRIEVTSILIVVGMVAVLMNIVQRVALEVLAMYPLVQKHISAAVITGITDLLIVQKVI